MKKIISTMLSIIVCLASICVPVKAEPSARYIHGDADCDGDLSIVDVTVIQRWGVGIRYYSFDPISADYDSDGEIDIIDATKIQRYLTGIVFFRENTYNQMNKNARAYVEEVRYDDDHSYSLMTKYIPDERTETSRPAPFTLDIPESGTLYLWDGNREISYKVKVGSFNVWNMTPGNDVTYLLMNERGEKIKAGLLYPTGQVRMINGGTNTFNIRDIGGWVCDGGTLKYGAIFRGCELNGTNYHISLSDEQKTYFKSFLGIRDEIDMRSDSEVKGADGEIGTEDDIKDTAFGDGVSYIRYNASYYAKGINLDNDYQTWIYSEIIKRVSEDVKNNKPCYIHCMAGADRTGTICAIIEALCGVPLGDIEKDYELTSLSAESARLRTNKDWKSLVDYLNSMPGDTFRDKTVNYALRAGVSIDEINSLRRGLIYGNPDMLYAHRR